MRQFVIPTIFTAYDKFTRPVMRMEAALVSLTTIGGVAGAKLERSLTRVSAAAMEVATSALTIGAAVVLPLALATKAAMDFEKQMSNVATLVDTTKENMDAMGASVLNIASRVPVAISDLTESLYQIRSAGVDASQAMGVLETSAKLSVAGLSSATDATKAVTSALVSFKQQGLTADQIANSFFLTVKEGKTKMEAINESFGSTAAIVATAGVKLQEFNAATAALTNSGMTASEAQTALRGSVIALIKPTSEMADVLQSMGYTGSDAGQRLIDKMGGIVPAMEAVKVAAGSAGESINKAFGRVQGLTAYTLLTGNLKGQFQANLKEQMQGVDALTSAYQKQLGTTAAQAQLAKNNLTDLGIRIGELLLPALTSLLMAVTPIIKYLADFAHNHKTLTGIIVKSIAIFGIAALAIGGISLAIGTVTKAIWLWGIATKAIGFSQGILSAVMKDFNFAMSAAPGYIKGAETAFSAMNNKGILLRNTLQGVAAALILINQDQIENYLTNSKFGQILNHYQAAIQGKIHQNPEAARPMLAEWYSANPTDAKQYVFENPQYVPKDIGRTFDSLDRRRDIEIEQKAQVKDAEDSLYNQHQRRENIPAQAQSDTSKDGKTSAIVNDAPIQVYVYQDKQGGWQASREKPAGMNIPFIGTTSKNYNNNTA